MSREEILEKVNEIFWDVFDDESIVVYDKNGSKRIDDAGFLPDGSMQRF